MDWIGWTSDMSPEERDAFLDAAPLEVITGFLGPFAVGVGLEVFLTGILTIQAWFYFRYFGRNDPCAIRILVGVLGVLNVVQACTDMACLVRVFVLGFGRFSVFARFHGLAVYGYGYTGVVQGLCQAFFLWRCYLLCNSKCVVAIGCVGIATSVVAGWCTTAILLNIGSVLPTGSDLRLLVTPMLYLAVSAVTDLFLATILITKLLRLRTGYPETEKLLYRITRLAFETTGVTTAMAITYLILYPTTTGNGAMFAFQYTIGKAYSISVLLTLLTRSNSDLPRGDLESNTPHETNLSDSGMPQFRPTIRCTCPSSVNGAPMLTSPTSLMRRPSFVGTIATSPGGVGRVSISLGEQLGPSYVTLPSQPLTIRTNLDIAEEAEPSKSDPGPVGVKA